MWHDGKMHGLGKYSYFVEGVNCKEFNGVSLEGSFDSGRDAESLAEYMVWYEDLLKPGLVNAVRNLGEKVAALIAEGVDANDPNREALATELLMRESSELKATEDEEPHSVWTRPSAGTVEAPACLTPEARATLSTVRALLARRMLVAAIASMINDDSTDPVETSKGAEGEPSDRLVFDILKDEDAKDLTGSAQLRISYQIVRMSVAYPDPREEGTGPIRGYFDFLNINEDAVDGHTCDWRLLRVDCGYEDTIDERAELENLIVSSSRGNKGKKK
ncbi:hypothetical protein Pmar_PMAR010078 [Perkinsus marinus ATCC 50983]|uniref:Uncharacterized protein n=1 Tax=Perkinsus marinus (strain ATCC 50983 / TXsc) TaxID=423536 RepID=C5K4S1_PERM5|nr:hypothetical protein Pmar_PMAR010078 [Perkinsus marinus ATCC 50983]EER20343.1 hypothetical protein Pmar_PMAR010078 [Perkinsus marinus ATCC 50983]|eukprot:XP_002788547.1 hypothetical protein Pmar_PMAR010078 [Perkinsus marinus ATCC 50983]